MSQIILLVITLGIGFICGLFFSHFYKKNRKNRF
jgi:uncharacterized protein YneF (UPF0154 family)